MMCPLSLTSQMISAPVVHVVSVPRPSACASVFAASSPTAMSRSLARCGGSPAARPRNETRVRRGRRSLPYDSDQASAGGAGSGWSHTAGTTPRVAWP